MARVRGRLHVFAESQAIAGSPFAQPRQNAKAFAAGRLQFFFKRSKPLLARVPGLWNKNYAMLENQQEGR
jgi:hypothetical protein